MSLNEAFFFRRPSICILRGYHNQINLPLINRVKPKLRQKNDIFLIIVPKAWSLLVYGASIGAGPFWWTIHPPGPFSWFCLATSPGSPCWWTQHITRPASYTQTLLSRMKFTWGIALLEMCPPSTGFKERFPVSVVEVTSLIGCGL